MPHPQAGKLRGILTAINTPFHPDGRLALEHMPALLDFQRAAGIDGVIVAGTNGEGTSLSVAERKQLLETVMAHRGDLLVVAGTGAAAVTDALDLTLHAAEVGADAVLVLPPFFFKNPTDEGVAAYFRPLLEHVDIPLLLYNIPQYSAVRITDGLMALLSDCPNLSGVKDSTGDWESSRNFIERYPHLRIFTGSDRLLARSLRHKSAGGISGAANCFPEVIVAARTAWELGDEAGLDRAQKRIDALLDILHRYPPMATSKSVLAHRGLPRLSVRPPLVDLTPSQEQALLGELREAGFLPA
ncbi:dihydrodipicolinate synthase/N-acetylneuraminate lyase [Chthonomonas calidirosea]|uniref:Dihydrodipicolinate synthase/N-acetylneuraminate lyase n=1 Tax=Chthonomonas calidirosea (strain DSM 23976 / ICMP 18418 / T49) TaxID=1303518 RepID=S0EZS7_CHTCT|nr:dihydrodipicolinate synthase family protein [Chthonomonas calidirosea]CCW36562.1 Dihydrodipicolinate synthase/N-acetylneuraminate lyase [Chthonomonas calidirosea T49]CEK16964.1 dihydrodipicolinate synthase/N-acetylneuraminate lyase [Chthonomonas calidirosea]